MKYRSANKTKKCPACGTIKIDFKDYVIRRKGLSPFSSISEQQVILPDIIL